MVLRVVSVGLLALLALELLLERSDFVLLVQHLASEPISCLLELLYFAVELFDQLFILRLLVAVPSDEVVVI